MQGQTALVTAIGSFAGDAVIGRLQQLGMKVVGCDIYPREWVANALMVDSFSQAPYATDTRSYLDFITGLVEGHGISYIVPLTDVEVDVFEAHRSSVEQAGARVCISPSNTLRMCRDKWAFFEFVRELDLPVSVIDTQKLASIEAAPELPVVAKPVNGRSSEGLHIVRNENDWTWLLEHVDQENYIVQPFIDGHVVAVDVVRQPQTEQVVAVPREELLRTLNGAGTSVRVFSDEKLAHACAVLADALGIQGCVNFEFICDAHGRYQLIECNPRFSGGVKFSCMAAYDCVGNHMRCFANSAIDEPSSYDSVFIARKYEEFITQ